MQPTVFNLIKATEHFDQERFIQRQIFFRLECVRRCQGKCLEKIDEKWTKKKCYFFTYYIFLFFHWTVNFAVMNRWREAFGVKKIDEQTIPCNGFLYHYKYQGWTSQHFDISFSVWLPFCHSVGLPILAVVFHAIILHISLNFIIIWKILFS